MSVPVLFICWLYYNIAILGRNKGWSAASDCHFFILLYSVLSSQCTKLLETCPYSKYNPLFKIYFCASGSQAVYCTVFNFEGLSTNNFRHAWQILSVKQKPLHPLFLKDNIKMDKISTKIKSKIVLIPDGPNSMSKFYLQIADKKLTTVFPLLFCEARASGPFC